MWPILKIFISVTLLAINVHGVETEIKNLIKRRELIEGIFRPISGNKMGNGGFADVFKGVNMIDNSDVALKFSTRNWESQHEYDMYTYLNAIDNPKVEKYGISPILYYNKCGYYTLTVFPLFECDLWQKKFELEVPFNTIDFLILFRDFVRQSKYMHSKGVRHDNIKPENIMLRKSRSFLIDFNISSKMNETRGGGSTCSSICSACRRYHWEIKKKTPVTRLPIDDWESFLYSMAMVADVKFAFFDLKKYRNYNLELLSELIGLKKDDTEQTIKKIRKDIKCDHLIEVMVEFANEVFKEDGSLPRYNYFDKFITKKIQDVIGPNQPAVFSWLKDHERDEAIKDLKDNPPATTEEIDDPKTAFVASDYKTPEYDYFVKRRDVMAHKAVKNYQLYLKQADEIDLQNEIQQMKEAAENEKSRKKKEKVEARGKSLSKCIPRRHR